MLEIFLSKLYIPVLSFFIFEVFFVESLYDYELNYLANATKLIHKELSEIKENSLSTIIDNKRSETEQMSVFKPKKTTRYIDISISRLQNQGSQKSRHKITV